ncbi:unnamed protein product [Amoebophrya sp. A25]|nr:unnamed protein product [Amoebophrya sp. A25]|eukprot:GSA25T00025135001.1
MEVHEAPADPKVAHPNGVARKRNPQDESRDQELLAEEELQNETNKKQKREPDRDNLIFLDLEFSCGFYDWANRVETEANNPPRILEAAVVITDKDLNELARGAWQVGGFTREYLENLSEFHQQNFRDGAPSSYATGEAGSELPDENRARRHGTDKKETTKLAVDGGENSKRRRLDAQEGKKAQQELLVGLFPPLEGHEGGNGLFTDMMTKGKPRAEVERALLSLLEEHCPFQACPIAGMSVQCDREILKTEMPDVYRHLSHRIWDVSTVVQGVLGHWWPEMRERWREDQQAHADYNHRALNDCEAAVVSARWIRKNFTPLPRAASSISFFDSSSSSKKSSVFVASSEYGVESSDYGVESSPEVQELNGATGAQR